MYQIAGIIAAAAVVSTLGAASPSVASSQPEAVAVASTQQSTPHINDFYLHATNSAPELPSDGLLMVGTATGPWSQLRPGDSTGMTALAPWPDQPAEPGLRQAAHATVWLNGDRIASPAYRVTTGIREHDGEPIMRVTNYFKRSVDIKQGETRTLWFQGEGYEHFPITVTHLKTRVKEESKGTHVSFTHCTILIDPEAER